MISILKFSIKGLFKHKLLPTINIYKNFGVFWGIMGDSIMGDLENPLRHSPKYPLASPFNVSEHLFIRHFFYNPLFRCIHL